MSRRMSTLVVMLCLIASGAAPAPAGSAEMRATDAAAGPRSIVTPGSVGYGEEDPATGWGTLTGSVVLPGGVAVEPGSVLTVRSGAGDGVAGQAEVAADATFGVTGLATGTYTVSGQVDGVDGRTYAGGVTASVTLGGLTSDVVLRATRTGSISGTLDWTDRPVDSGDTGQVSAYDAAGSRAATAGLDADGGYTVELLPAGEYRLLFELQDGAGATSWEWWDDLASPDQAEAVPLSAGAALLGYDATLGDVVGGGTITGRVTGPDGAALLNGSSGTVHVASRDGEVDRVVAFDDTGTFSLANLRPGDYYDLEVVPDGTDYLPEWWCDAASSEAATAIAVTAGATGPEIEPHLNRTGAILGTVSGPDGSPILEGTPVRVRLLQERSSQDEFGIVRTANESVADMDLAGDGSFAFDGLAAGDYLVEFAPYDDALDTLGIEWWHDASAPGVATKVHVGDGQTVSGIDARLGAGGSLSGTVTGPGGAALSAGSNVYARVHASDGSVVSDEWVGDIGEYVVRGLPAGDYRVEFLDLGGAFVGQWWNGRAQANADLVHVTAGAERSGVDARLDLTGAPTGTTGMIKGRLTGPGGAALRAGFTGSVYAYAGPTSTPTHVDVDDSGTFEIGSLEPGQYRLRVVSDDYHYRTQWWNQRLSAATADPVTVTANHTTSGIVVALASTSVPLVVATPTPTPTTSTPAPSVPVTPPPPPAPVPTPTVAQPPAPAVPTSVVRVKAVSKGGRLSVNVDPDLKGAKYWKLTVFKLRSDGTWAKGKAYRTHGKKETRTLNLKKGTYRVVVAARYGLAASTSAAVTLRR